MKSIIFFCFACLAANIAHAQTLEYEFAAILPLDKMSVERDYSRKNPDSLMQMHTIKFVDETMYNNDGAMPFYTKIMQEEEKRNISFCFDKDCINYPNHSEPAWNYKSLDTIAVKDSFSGERLKVLSNAIFEDNIRGYLLLHKIKYDTITKKMSIKIEQMATVERVYGYTRTYDKMLFWTRLNNEKPIKPFNIKDTNIVWAKRATLSIADSSMIENKKQPPFSKILIENAKNKVYKLYSSIDQGWQVPLDDDEDSSDRLLFSTTDTIITYDPVTYQEHIKVVHSEYLKQENIKCLRFKLLYYFDEKSFQIGCTIERIGIEEDLKDKNGVFIQRRAFVYIKP